MVWEVEFKGSAEKTFLKLDKQVQERVRVALDLLADEMTTYGGPKRSDVTKMQGQKDRYRLKISGWRIIFRFEHGRLTILVLEVGTRGDIY